MSTHVAGQETERLIGYRTFPGEITPLYTGLIFDHDSARFWYSSDDIYENPWQTYLNVPTDTMKLFLLLQLSDYMDTYHPDYLLHNGNDVYNFRKLNSRYIDSVILFRQFEDSLLSQYLKWGMRYQGALISEFSEFYYDDQWEIWTMYHTSYNENGQLTEDLWGDVDFNGDTTFIWGYLYTYQDDLLHEKFVYDNDMMDTSITTYTYDAENRVVSKVLQSYSHEESEFVNTLKEVYTYTANHLTDLRYYYWEAGNWLSTGSHTLTYTGNQLSQVYSYDPDDGDTLLEREYFYHISGYYDSIKYYDKYGNRQVEKFLYDDNSLSYYTNDYYVEDVLTFSSITDYDYNTAGQLTNYVEYSSTDLSQIDHVAYCEAYDYSYGEHTITRDYNKISHPVYFSDITETSNDTATTTLHYLTTCFYYENASQIAGTQTETVYIHVYPSPADEEIWLVIGGIIPGSTVTTQITNIAGQKVFYETEDADAAFTKRINCSFFSPGIYIVSVSDGTNISWQKVMVR